MRIIVVDGNPPWVRSLFAAMPADVEVYTIRLISLGLLAPRSVRLSEAFRVRNVAPNRWEQQVVIPGWTKAYRLSTAIVTRCVRRLAASRSDLPVRIVYNVPQYAGVARHLADFHQIYYAYDPYVFYEWSAAQVKAWEQELFDRCRTIVAISRDLQADFQEASGRQVYYCPNAASASFIARLAAPLDPPEDLPPGDPKVVGCIGAINDSYDWDLLAELVARCRDLLFVFIGPVESDPAVRSAVEPVLRQPNVRWLGPKPHDTLPRYLQRFDVCLNPLRVTLHSNRRSPLRLYDYLSTDKPIVSTALSEALVHGPHVATARDPTEMADLLKGACATRQVPNLSERKAYISVNTWECRAAQFHALLSEKAAS